MPSEEHREQRVSGRDANHPEDHCGCCGATNPRWTAPSPLWNQVMRGGDINGDEIYGGIVCLTCFARLAEENGVALGWRLDAEDYLVGVQTVTPSGRKWNDETWLWEDEDA